MASRNKNITVGDVFTAVKEGFSETIGGIPKGIADFATRNVEGTPNAPKPTSGDPVLHPQPLPVEETPIVEQPVTSAVLKTIEDVPFKEPTDVVVPPQVRPEDQRFTRPNGLILDGLGNIIFQPPASEEAIPKGEFTIQAEDILRDITGEGGLNEDLAGRADFEAEKREEFGVTQLTTTFNDLLSQQQGLNLKSQDLANQLNFVEAQLQQESEGRGRTVGGVAPIAAGRRRGIALEQASVASQSLVVQGSLAAVQGSLANARILVQEAVDVKYGALLQEKSDAIESLELLNLSGVLDREETQRAEEAIRRENAEIRQIEEDKLNQADIWNIAVEAAPILGKLEGGASILQEIQNAPTPEAAFQIAFDNGVFAQPAGEAFTLGQGQVRFDAQGNVIAQVAPKVSDAAVTAAIERDEKDAAAQATRVNTVGLVSSILADDNLNNIVGGFLTRKVSTAESGALRSQMLQLRGLTAIGAREKLKGSGTISDGEQRMLEQSVNSINGAIQDDGTVDMNHDDFVQQLKNLQGFVSLTAGAGGTVIITDPAPNGESFLYEVVPDGVEPETENQLTRKDLDNVTLNKFLIDFQ